MNKGPKIIGTYLSFATDAGCLGVAYMDEPDFMTAVMKSHALGINPGGEVMSFPIPDTEEVMADISKCGWNVLVPVQKIIDECGGKSLRELEACDS